MKILLSLLQALVFVTLTLGFQNTSQGAIGTAGTNTSLAFTTTAAKGLTNATLAGWVYRGSSLSFQMFGFGQSNTYRFQIGWVGSNRIYMNVVNGGTNYIEAPITNLTGWHHLCLTFDGSQATNANKVKCYLDGNALTMAFQSGNAPTSLANNADMETFRVGYQPNETAPWSTGYFANIGFWTSTLTADQVRSLSKRFSPRFISPSTLVHHLPLVRELIDVKGGAVITDQSTTKQNHPPMFQ
jgi:hypothetical protein